MSLSIIHLTTGLAGGGAEVDTVRLACASAAAGHRVVVVAAAGPLAADLAAAGVTHVPWPLQRRSLLTLAYVGPLLRLLRRERADVLHAHSRLPAWLAWIALRRWPELGERRPLFVTTIHGRHHRSLWSSVVVRSDQALAVSRWVADEMARDYPWAKDLVSVVPRGIDAQRFPFGHHPQGTLPAVPAGRFLVLFPHRLVRGKGHLDLVRVLVSLRQAGLDVHAWIAGGHDARRAGFVAEVEAAIAAGGLTDRLTFLGHRQDVRELMAAADVVLNLSPKPETFGLSVLEALSLGTPVVAYDHGGVGEVLRTVYPAGAVAPGDTAAAAMRVLAVAGGQLPPPPPSHPFTLAASVAATLRLYHHGLGRVRNPA